MRERVGAALPPGFAAPGAARDGRAGRAASAGRRGLLLGLLALAACGRPARVPDPAGRTSTGYYPNETPALRQRIEYWAGHHDVPVALVQRVILRESSHRPGARNGPYYGLMQILPQTARTMGYRGPDAGLLDADTNLRWAVKYLRGAWLVAEADPDAAVMWYARGYYYEAKRKGLLEETGLRS